MGLDRRSIEVGRMVGSSAVVGVGVRGGSWNRCCSFCCYCRSRGWVGVKNLHERMDLLEQLTLVIRGRLRIGGIFGCRRDTVFAAGMLGLRRMPVRRIV